MRELDEMRELELGRRLVAPTQAAGQQQPRQLPCHRVWQYIALQQR